MTVDSRSAIARHAEAFNTGQVDVMLEMYSEDAVLHIAGNTPISGTFRGHAAIREEFEHSIELVAGGATLHAELPESILTSDRYQMVFYRASGERKGNQLDITVVIAAKIGPDAKFQELWLLGDDQAAYDRFWS
jgi:ketosteroid isomerase-like protein